MGTVVRPLATADLPDAARINRASRSLSRTHSRGRHNGKSWIAFNNAIRASSCRETIGIGGEGARATSHSSTSS